ncbi:MAG TPA: hypothetical protein DCP67_08730, partial [Planctomycetaceae bacterium]|nr:hypothetical protein [Planctomycetaceae bacterium]
QQINIALPAGPYLRGEITDAIFQVGGDDSKQFTGNLLLEQHESGGTKKAIIAASNVGLSFTNGDTNYLSISDGNAVVILDNNGTADQADDQTAGIISGQITSDVPHFHLNGNVQFEFNTDESNDVNESFTINGNQSDIILEAGDFWRFTGDDIHIAI